MSDDLSPRQRRRQQKLIELLKDNGGPAQVGRETGVQRSYLSAMKAGSRGVGDEVAAKLEAAYGLQEGWFDQPEVFWPFTAELYQTVLKLDTEELVTLERVMRHHLKLPQIAAVIDTNQSTRITPDSAVAVKPSPPAHQPTSFVDKLVDPGAELERREVDQVHGKRRGGKPKGTPPRR